MNKRIRILDKGVKVLFLFSILFSSFGREFFNIKFVNYFFWLGLGVFLGFQLYKYEMKRMWNKENEK